MSEFNIDLKMTEWEAEQLKAAVDYLISDCDEQSLIAVSNRLNEILKENAKCVSICMN